MPDLRFSTEIENRYQFGAMCHARGLLGTAIELGVHRGDFAGHFLGGWGGAKYHAVDLYQPYCDIRRSRDIDKQIAHTRLARFADRIAWEEKDCLLALLEHEKGSLDFVYIDGDHTYWAVNQEIIAAWERVKPDGILAGHDFFHGTPDVIRAVKEFSDREQTPVWVTTDQFMPFSWYAIKPHDVNFRYGEKGPEFCRADGSLVPEDEVKSFLKRPM